MIGYATTWLQLKMDRLKADRRAVTAMEYGLIAALIAVVIIGAVSQLGGKLRDTFNNISYNLPSGNR